MPIQNPYDHSLKIIARTYPEHFLRLGFPGQPMKLLGTLSNVELALEIDRVDFLHEIELNGERAYFHVDFQLTHTEECPRRFFVYNGMVTELKKPYPVITLPIYLRPREKEIPDCYEVKVGGVVFHKFTYEPVRLWMYVDQILSGEYYVFAPLLPVLLSPLSEEHLFEERQVILRHEADQAKRRTLLTTAILVAAQSKLFAPDFLWELFREDEMSTIDDPFMEKLFFKIFGTKLAEEEQKLKTASEVLIKNAIEQKESEVKRTLNEEVKRAVEHEVALAHAAQREAEAAQREAQVAHQEAETEATLLWQETILKILEHRFQNAPIQLLRLLHQVTADQRNQVTDLVLDATDAEQCLQSLKQLLIQ